MQEKFFSKDFIEQVKSKNDIVSLIGKYVRLEKKGRDFWGCCPFHHEKTPSFVVHADEQYYHCFGCGESGNVITFLTKYENLDYPTAIKVLAENAGMELPELENSEKYREQKRVKERTLKILALAKDIYKENIYLPQAKLAQEYIKKRKVTKRELDAFEFGYSTDPFDIVNKLKAHNFTNEELKSSGVCEIGKSGKPYDFLSERLIFPIVNSYGECIGFSGRDLTGNSRIKYKNTAATVVFNKSKTVYAINLVKKLKQEQFVNEIIIVEGQFDVITMHRYGFRNVVACLGTAITEEHIREIKRFVDNITLCLDGDAAGVKATLRTLEILTKFSEINVRVAIMPEGADPDEILSGVNGKENMQKILDNAVAPMEFKIFNTKKKYDLGKTNEKSLFVKEILKEINKLSTEAEKEIYLTEIKKITGISVEILRRTLPQNLAVPVQEKTTTAEQQNFEKDVSHKALVFILASLIRDKPYARFKKSIENLIFNPETKEIYKHIQLNKANNEANLISSLYDIFPENNIILKEIVNFNFSAQLNEEEYFKNCLWVLIKNDLEFRKNIFSKQYNEENNSSQKTELLKNIAQIDLQLKNKNLGEFIDE